MIRLLDACIRKLAERGMEQMLIDAIRGGEEGFQSLGTEPPPGRSASNKTDVHN